MNIFYTVFDFPQTPINSKHSNLANKCTTMLKSYVMYACLVLFFLISGNTFGQNKYKLITSTSDLVAGDKYIISSAQSGTSAQLLGYQNTNNRPQATATGGSPFTITTGVITCTPATVNSNTNSPYEIIIEQGSDATHYYLKDALQTNSYLVPSTGSGKNNYLKGKTTSGGSDWTITFSSNAAVITNTGDPNTDGTGRNILRYNSSSSLFSCYSSGQSSIYLFRRVYTVIYDGNGSDGGTVPSDASSPYFLNTTVTVLGAGTMTKTGFTFAGWNTAADGSGTAYAASATFSITSNVTLYAQWTPSGGKTVTFNGNENNGGSMSPQTASSSTVLTANAFTKTGYSFSKWNTAADGSGTDYADGATYNFAADMSLYAQWSINNYNVVYNGNSQSSGAAPATQNGNYNTTITLATNSGSLAKTGFAFTGWNTASNGSGTHYNTSASFTIPASHTTLYAEWTPTYTLTYNGNSNTAGSAPTDASSPYISGTSVSTLSNSGALAKTDGTYGAYTFDGWNTLANGTGTSYTAPQSGAFNISANTTLYAKWRYTVTYDANGGSGAPATQNAVYSTALTLSATTPTRSGYTFSGWNTAADGSGTDFAANASYPASGGNVTLYAKWTVYTGPCFSKNGPTFTTSGYTIGGDADAGGSPTSTIRLASNGTAGSISTTATGVTAGNVTVKFRAKGYDSDEQQVTVTLDGVPTLVTGISDAGFVEYTVMFSSVPANPTLSFSTLAGKRVHIGNVNLYCVVPCTAPITQASTFGTGTINQNDAAITWSRGSGSAGVIVLARAGSAVNADPVSGTSYTDNTIFGSGDEIGTGNFVVYKGTGTGVTVTGLNTNTTYHFAIYEYNTTDICYHTTELTGNITTDPADVVLSSSNPAVAAANITEGTTNNIIYKFTLTPSGGNVNLTGVTISTSGTYAAVNLSNFKCWYSTDATFNSGTDVLLATKSSSLGVGNHTFPSFTAQIINKGSTGYIFITTDLACPSTATNTIIVNAMTTSNLTFTTANKSGTAYDGGTQTIQDATPNNVTGFATATCENSGVNLSWTLPSVCFDNVLIFAKAGSPVTATPTGNGVSYTANAAFGSGTPFDGGYCVYKNNGTSVNITGLTNGTSYYFKIFTRNGTTWSSGVTVNCTPTINYCTATSTNASYEFIEGVEFNTINNPSSNTTYTDYYPTISTTVEKGETYTLSVYNGDYYSSDVLLGWIDWNQNGLFTDPGEQVVATTSGDPAPYFVNITVPATAANGNTRMRLRLYDSGVGTPNNTPCGTHTYGEVEDYKINVITPCTPTHNVTSFTPTTGPVGTYVTIIGTGLTTSTTVSFNNIASTEIEFISSTKIIARVPAGATTGLISVTEGACPIKVGTFTVINESGSCVTIPSSYTDLMISEIYDSDAYNVAYVELFNPTSSPITLTGVY